jgi:pimeloyl-ACP methyl ester carboxylesterase
MPFADSQGIRIFYDDTGEGEPILLCLPGWCNTHAIFAPLAERLSADHRVLAMDWRGHGNSQASERDFGFAEMAGDAVAVMQDSGAHSVIPIAQGQAPWAAVQLHRLLGERVPKMVISSWPVISLLCSTCTANPAHPSSLRYKSHSLGSILGTLYTV